MRWSFKVGRAFGIELRIHITFFLIIAWAAYIWGVGYENGAAGAFYGAMLISLLFVCVVIHELCHSLMAIHFGGEVASITLLPIGGVSLLKNMPDDPRKELLVSLVGPLSNVVIGFLLIPFLYLVPNPVAGPWGAFTNMDVLTGVSVQALVSYLLFINFMLAFFNLLPAFPLDGGRVLRSILARRMSYVRATRVAVITGQVFAFVLGITGLLLGAWLWIFIAIFIYMGAEQEGAGAQMKTVLSQLNVGQAVARNIKVLSPADKLSDVVAVMLHNYQEDFPVVADGRLEGVLTRANLITGLHNLGPDATADRVMEKNFPIVSSTDLFSKVYEKINDTGVRAVAVVDEGKLVGMVTMEHLSEVFMLLTASDRPMSPGAVPPA